MRVFNRDCFPIGEITGYFVVSFNRHSYPKKVKYTDASLLEIIGHAVGRLLRRYPITPDQAEECVYHAVSRTWLHYKAGNVSDKAYPNYLYVSARNRLMVMLKKDIVEYHDDMSLFGCDAEQQGLLSSNEEVEKLYRAIGKLEGRSREIIELMLEFPDATPQGLCDRLGVNARHYSVLKYRAIRELRDLYIGNKKSSSRSAPAQEIPRPEPEPKVVQVVDQFDRLAQAYRDKLISYETFVSQFNRLSEILKKKQNE